ncbi:MAG: rRNA pseudouridine synthase [Erysipelothrix sp.]|nr:rRNA pseudouridine synthase [Erysipelothrix sp.]
MIKLERLQKVIAQSGYTSRRKAEQLIVDKRVKVNNQIVSELGSQVGPDDIILIDDKEIVAESKVYYMINKPKDVLCSVSDDRGRKVVVDLIKEEKRIYPVGRLDFDTTGLLMLTNDGDFTNAMIHPSFEINKTYQVVVDKFITDTMRFKLERGVLLDGEKTLPAKLVVDHFDKKKQYSQVTITIREGKNRQVKRMFEAIGCKVISLHRSKVAFMTLEGLAIGQYRKMLPSEISRLIQLAKSGDRK